MSYIQKKQDACKIEQQNPPNIIKMEYPACWENHWYVYRPRMGIDPYISTSTFWRGALHYAMAKSRNMSEEVCQNKAEEAMFRSTFSGITYGTEAEKGLSQGKKTRNLASYNWPPMSLPRNVETGGE